MIAPASWIVRVDDIVVFIAMVIVVFALCARVVGGWRRKRKTAPVEVRIDRLPD